MAGATRRGRRRRRADKEDEDSGSEGSTAAPAARRARTGPPVNLVVQPGLNVIAVDAPAVGVAAGASEGSTAAAAPVVVDLEVDGLEREPPPPAGPPPPVDRNAWCTHFREGRCTHSRSCRFRHK